MGRHGFPDIFPAKVWHAAAFSCNVMAAEEKVASTLNRLVDRVLVFLNVLSPRDKSSMSDLIVDFSWRIRKRMRTGGKRSLVIE